MSEGAAIKVLGLAGSARERSFNKILARAALTGCEAAGASATFVDLRDYPLPIYDGDLEASQGLPENAARLQEILQAHDALLIATPEYNGSIPPLLKNTIDWMTRSAKATPDLSGFHGKLAALLAASPGPLGGMRGIRVVRELLSGIGVTVLADQVTMRAAHEQVSEAGELSEAYRERAAKLGAELARMALAARC